MQRRRTDRPLACRTPHHLAHLRYSRLPTQYGIPQHPLELEDEHRVVNYMSPRTGRETALNHKKGEKSGVERRSAVMVNESSAHVVAGVAGLGIIQTPTFHGTIFMAKPHIERGELVPILPEWQPPPHSVYVVYLPNSNLSNKLRLFIDWVTELLRK